MNTLLTTAGNAYTKDDDYAKFSGRLVQTFTTTYYDPKIKAFIKRTVEYIDVGRADSVPPVDVDAEMQPEEWGGEESGKFYSKGTETIKRKARERWADMQMKITAYLIKYGPSHVKGMALDLEYPRNTIGEFIAKREGRAYFRAGNVGRAVLWGVIGIHDQKAA